jgi:hypothetical protein
LQHLHDGGSNLQLSRNGEILCDSKAYYGGSPEYSAPAEARAGAHGKIEHISRMTGCNGKTDFKNATIKAGEKWRIEALYDYDAHKPSAHRDGDDKDTVM